MKQFSKPIYILLVIAQISVLIFMISKRMHLLANGQKIILECEPRDPRSLFSGDYVILNYKISQLDKNILPDNTKSKIGKRQPIYVALTKNNNTPFWTAQETSTSLHELKKKYKVIIMGHFKDRWSNTITYGVEEYFVPQKQGKRIEKQMADVSVEVSVTDDGESAINKLFINGKEVTFY